VFGLSTQETDYQREVVERLPRPLLTPRSVFATLPRVNTFLTPAGN
jgi:hypothetical protein